MEKMYIWQRLEGLTNSYHSDGGAVAIASTEEGAQALIRDFPVYDFFGKVTDRTWPVEFPEPSAVFPVEWTEGQRRVWIFPDVGCC